MYSLLFVQRAASKLGADFYLKHKEVWRHGIDVPTSVNSYKPYNGTMMPFDILDLTSHRGKSRVSTIYGEAGDSHPAVLNWSITKKGSVHIQQAPIIASSDVLHQPLPWPDVPVSIEAQTSPGEYVKESRVGLYQWISEQPDILCTYTITVSKQLEIILQGIRDEARRSETKHQPRSAFSRWVVLICGLKMLHGMRVSWNEFRRRRWVGL